MNMPISNPNVFPSSPKLEKKSPIYPMQIAKWQLEVVIAVLIMTKVITISNSPANPA